MIKARHTKVNEYKELPNGDTVVYEDFRGYPMETPNIYCIDGEDSIKWYAELQFENDVFTALMAWDSGYNKEASEMEESFVPNTDSFVAYSSHGILASFCYETGKILESEFIK